jgi:2-methylcitrate dehydratase PrpD
MNELEIFVNQIVDFIYDTNLEDIPTFYYDAFLNYMGVTYQGAKKQPVSIVINTLLNEYKGLYQPISRQEKLTLSDVAMIDCLSSSLLAYDDIHFETSTHPCGVVLSAILAYSRKEAISLKETLNALYIGMEVECLLGTVMFKDNSNNGWYTTGIVGSIGVASALSHLLHFNKEQIKNAISLASQYASGTRGSHGSIAGSFIPAIASKNGYMATMLVRNGMTCSYNSIIGVNGLIKQINPNIHINQQVKHSFISMNTSCKPYPYGFISFSAIELLLNINVDVDSIDYIDVKVSSRVKLLGSNNQPKTMYDGFVSLPYIIASLLINKENAYKPLSQDFTITKDIKTIMNKIKIEEDKQLTDEEIYITINHKIYYLKDAYGSNQNIMKHQDIINKFNRIVDIENKEEFIKKLYHDDIENIYEFIYEYFYENLLT